MMDPIIKWDEQNVTNHWLWECGSISMKDASTSSLTLGWNAAKTELKIRYEREISKENYAIFRMCNGKNWKMYLLPRYLCGCCMFYCSWGWIRLGVFENVCVCSSVWSKQTSIPKHDQFSFQSSYTYRRLKSFWKYRMWNVFTTFFFIVSFLWNSFFARPKLVQKIHSFDFVDVMQNWNFGTQNEYKISVNDKANSKWHLHTSYETLCMSVTAYYIRYSDHENPPAARKKISV